MIEISNLPADVTQHILKFREYLITSYPMVDELQQQHDWHEDLNLLPDWFQASWELLVERELLGPGKRLTSPAIPQGHRVTETTSNTEYYVSVQPASLHNDLASEHEHTIQSMSECRVLRFIEFVSQHEVGGHGVYPPFEMACAYSEDTHQIFYVPVELVRFELRPVDY